jgi:protein arginine N-methyltransferase 2
MDSGDFDEEIAALADSGQQLINAILEGQTIGRVKALIDTGAPVWYQSEDEGMSTLHAAAYTEREDIVEMLITEGAVWNAGIF